MKPKILISRVIPEPAVELLRRHCEVDYNSGDRPLGRAGLVRRLKGKRGLVCLLTDDIDDAVLASPGLEMAANVAVGFNNVDVAAATRRGVLISNTPGVLTETTADFAWTLLLAAARRVGEAERFLRAGKYKGWGILMLLGVDVHGKTLGLVGLGRIGQAVARRARGFGMRLLYTDLSRATPEAEKEAGAEFVPLERLLKDSDFVSLHVPLLESTRHMIGERQFAMMKPTAVLVNTSRGPVVDEAALVRALKARRIAGAGLDVYEREPKLSPGLAKLENAVLAPHIASATVETRTKMAMMAAENLLAGLNGQRPPNLANPECWDARAKA
ncbi:MAG TPA: D-glycerate dehydrogenase [Elusimicrobiota bacterium]|jgi:lactate dehydrogenase-like 2-hydroxyacid dehydrogenase|nr:D-glycerate dehydrogenase [Elusimicrobiota bacterium]